jgi:hypothetical protein
MSASSESNVQVEARIAPRLRASQVPTITGVRLSPFGTEATLLNISATGALVECASRLRLGTVLTLVFDGGFAPSSVEGRVARSAVAAVDKKGKLLYHVGVAFTKPIALATPAPAAPVQREAPAAPQLRVVAPAAAASVMNRW